MPGVLTRFPFGRRRSSGHVRWRESCCQVAGFTGAVVLSRNQVRCSGQEYPLAQKVGFRASKGALTTDLGQTVAVDAVMAGFEESDRGKLQARSIEGDLQL